MQLLHINAINKSTSFTISVFLFLFLILGTFVSQAQSNNSEEISGKSKLGTGIGLKDTLGHIKGKIVDSITNEPVPFVKITFHNGASSPAIVSDEVGEFYITSKNLTSNIVLSAVGYQEYSCHLTVGQVNLFRLTPKSNQLPSVTVSAQIEKNAGKIIKRVEKNMEKNYGSPAFDQTFNIYASAQNYDTLKGEITDLRKQHFYEDQTSMMDKTLLRRSDTTNYDANFFDFIGVPQLYMGNILPYQYDIIRKGWVIGKKRDEYFDFKLLGHYYDKKYGSVFRVGFKPRSPYYSFYDGKNINASWGPWGYFNGEMLISENDYAVVNIKYVQDGKIDNSKKILENEYHSPAWKADRVSKIVPNSLTFYNEHSYVKDSATGKYFIQAIKLECYENGYQVETNKNVQLYFIVDSNSLGIENVHVVAN